MGILRNRFSLLLRLFCPIFGSGPDTRATSMEEAAERQTYWHRSDPASHWIPVVGLYLVLPVRTVCDENL